MPKKRVNLLIRDRSNPTRQMQLGVNLEDGSLGVVLNNGFELLIIESACIDDVSLKYIAPAPDAVEIEPHP